MALTIVVVSSAIAFSLIGVLAIRVAFVSSALLIATG
jgi:hypothetical protein